ncbi:MAG: DEAD/DEAH box helicase [Fimbriimonadaceae bacterium]|nr:DEAD/DEAH box helicase [Fimbriimonadaceae bacterium]
MTPSPEALELLTSFELEESRLLAWGATAGQWTLDEVKNLAGSYSGGAELVEELLQAGLLVATPTGGYRSRCAETIRLISTLRQSFASRPVTDGRAIILDYRFLHRPRRRPRRSVTREEARERISGFAKQATSTAIEALLPETVSEFQVEAAIKILEGLSGGPSRAIMISAGTGSGKTLAFYLPVLGYIAAAVNDNPGNGVVALAIYPRNELLKDQFRTLVASAQSLWVQNSSSRPLSAATWFSLTPYNAKAAMTAWRKISINNSHAYICPFLLCPVDDCKGRMAWIEKDLLASRERLVCVSCGKDVDERFLRLTRSSAKKSPPDIMLSTTESLNRQLAYPANLRAFGIKPASLKVVLLDELHIYEGTTGAQNAYLFRRLRHALGRQPLWVALSATLRNAGDFLSQCVNVPLNQVEVVTPDTSQMKESGAEYLLAVRHDPASGAGTLSTTIQTAMVLTRCLDALEPDIFAPPLTSAGVSGSKVFAFTDKLDVTNRLYWDIMDAEGWAYPGRAKNRPVLSLAHLRSETQDRMRPPLRESPDSRDPLGQWWWLPELLGHGLDIDQQLNIGRTSSQDRGVNERAELIIATSTLEVGFDDDTVGAVIQHKAPHSAASFLQRKGRAGRNPKTRPWTVVVLSDWGRDRAAWDAYETLFDPELPPKSLPLNNRYVQRVQCVYVLLEWLSREVEDYAKANNVWSDMTGPADVLEPESKAKRVEIETRQKHARQVLESLLVPGPARNRLRRYIRQALGLTNDARGLSAVDCLLWDGPRPLLLAVVPTLVRRLRDKWEFEKPSAAAPTVTRRIPLRDFAPGNLFDDLLATDVSFSGPGLDTDELIDTAFLPVLRTIRDFMPGRVSRHFGVRADSKRHWVPITYTVDAGPMIIDVQSIYAATLQGAVRVGEATLPLLTPTHVALENVPAPVKDYSSVEPIWENCLSSEDSGTDLALPESVRGVFKRVVCHVHSRGNAVRQVRFARRAVGSVFQPDKLEVELEFCDSQRTRVAIGQEVMVDGLEVHVSVPLPEVEPSAAERTAWLDWYIAHSDLLPRRVDRFARQILAWATQVVWSRATLGEFQIETLSDEALAQELERAAFLFGQARNGGNPGEAFGSQDGDDGSAAARDEGVAYSEEVAQFVRGAILLAQADSRTEDWLTWYKRRYTLTAATVLLRSMSSLARGVDNDSLVVDLDADDDCLAWITETGPGGIGAIESCMRAIREAPHLVSYSLATTLAPTDLETMDHDMVAVIAQQDEILSQRRQAVVNAWSGGHDAALRQLESFYARLAELGVVVQRFAKTAIATRLLGPGADPGLFDGVSEWLDLRSRLLKSGVSPNSRVLAAVLSAKKNYDSILQLPDDVEQQRRSRAIANVLWPSGSDVLPTGATNPYADLPPLNLPALRFTTSFAPARILVHEWDTATREAVHAALLSAGEVRLVFLSSAPEFVRSALLDLQMAPVEDGTIFVHPSVVAVLDVESETQVWLRMQGWYR